MNRIVPFSMRLDPKVKAALKQAADRENRSLTNLIEKILLDWIAWDKAARDKEERR